MVKSVQLGVYAGLTLALLAIPLTTANADQRRLQQLDRGMARNQCGSPLAGHALRF